MKRFFFPSIITCFVLLLAGCGPAKEIAKEIPSAPPPAMKKPRIADLSVTIASVNLAKLTKRIEKKDIEEFVEALRKEKVDIVTLQGLNRYPGLTTRIDILDELGERTEMRSVFGETIMTSGRQNGNAVMSNYPLRSNENTHYEGLWSGNFEATLQVVIDCGARDLIVISTNLPEKAPESDLAACVARLDALRKQFDHQTIIVAGNLPTADVARKPGGYESTSSMNDHEAPRLWFSGDGSLSLIHQRTQQTSFGAMMLAHFGLYRQSEP